MAEKKNNVVENPNKVDPIKLTDNVTGDIYVLEFDRATVKFAEDRGFNIRSIEEGALISGTEELFWYAFRKHQPKLSRADTDKILYEKLKGMPEGMLRRLIDLYVAPCYSLAQSEEDAKNATMTAEF